MRAATLTLTAAFVVATSIGVFAVHKDSSPSSSPDTTSGAAFSSGVKHLNAGDKAEQKAEQKKALDEFGKALKDFQAAVRLDPKNHRAFNGLGYAYRKTGDYNKALESYSAALQISPNFPDAIEYRAEAFLGLNRTEDAKQAYLALFASSRTHADLLLKAMKAWVEKRHANPDGVDPAALATFEAWLHERAALSERTVDMARNTPHTSWR